MNPDKDSNLPAVISNLEGSLSGLNRTQNFRPSPEKQVFKPTLAPNALDQPQNFRPSFAPKATARQLCLLVLDASGSMESVHYGGHTKAVAANEAAQGLIHRIKTSSRRANFQVGVINFGTKAIVRQLPIPAIEMDHTAPVIETGSFGTKINANYEIIELKNVP